MTSELRVVHTSDWHLGHRLHGVDREAEHRAFFAFLLDALADQRADALLVTGDVFEAPNPSSSAQALYYSFLSAARDRIPGLDIVVIAGNHDSARRLAAPAPILDKLGVRVVGALRRRTCVGRAPTAREDVGEAGLDEDDVGVDIESMIVPLTDQRGAVAAFVGAVPYLRFCDLPAHTPDSDGTHAAVRRIYQQVTQAMQKRRLRGQALLATGHLHMRGAQVSADSERSVLGGEREALPTSVFPASLDYVALGHLHRAQAVAGLEHIRYAGSPIPLSMAEVDYPHQVRFLRFVDGRLSEQEAMEVPRRMALLRVPPEGPDGLDRVLHQLDTLAEVPSDLGLPLLEVRVRLEGPRPTLRQEIEAVLRDRPFRLAKISLTMPARGAPLASVETGRSLSALTPEQVFAQCCARKGLDEPSPALEKAFAEVVEIARQRVSAPEVDA